MSLRSDVRFVATVIVGAIRQILGETCQALADYLLQAKLDTPVEAPREVTTRPKHVRVVHRRETISPEPPPEVPEPDVKPKRPRDRSLYNPKDHGPYKIASIGILTVLFEELSPKMSVPALAKILITSTDSSIRTACKTMVKDGILSVEYDSGVRSDVYWIRDSSLARSHLTELKESAPMLPQTSE